MTLAERPVRTRPTVADFRDRHLGETVYLLAAGGSMNYFDRHFWADKTVIAVNEIAVRWLFPEGVRPSVIYGVCKEGSTLEEITAGTRNGEPIPGQEPATYPLFASRHENGHTANPPRDPEAQPANVILFDHELNKAEGFDAYVDWPTNPDALVVSMSTITSGMHLAALMVGKGGSILVSGHDCGQLGPVDYVDGYTAPTADWKEPWLIGIERQSIAVKRELERRYGCRIYGLSPFITPNLEGVPYRGVNRINDW